MSEPGYQDQRRRRRASLVGTILAAAALLTVAAAITLLSEHNYQQTLEHQREEASRSARLRQSVWDLIGGATRHAAEGKLDTAENEFMNAYVMAAGDKVLGEQVLQAKARLYSVIEIPAQGFSASYRLAGTTYVLFKPGSAEGGMRFKLEETATLVASDDNWVAVTSGNEVFTPAQFRTLLTKRGQSFGPYNIPMDAIMRFSFRSTDGGSKRVSS